MRVLDDNDAAEVKRGLVRLATEGHVDAVLFGHEDAILFGGFAGPGKTISMMKDFERTLDTRRIAFERMCFGGR
jgi:hypothetical protein